MRKMPAPSILAASSSSWGRLRKYWRNMKMKKGTPNHPGTMSGKKVSIQCNVRNKWKIG